MVNGKWCFELCTWCFGLEFSLEFPVDATNTSTKLKVQSTHFDPLDHLPFTIYDSHMSAKLSVIFYIVLCLEIGIVLTLLPWVPQGTLGLSDWSNNYFLLYAA